MIEALIRAGAFDSIEPNRALLFANVGLAMEAADQAHANANQGGLFDMFGDDVAPAVEMVATRPWNDAVKLAEEKLAIGFYLSGHPFSAYAQEVRAFIKTTLSRLTPRKEPQLLAGFVTGIRVKMGNRGKMAFVELDDGSSKREIGLFGDSYEVNRNKLKEDIVLVVQGKVSEDSFSGGLRIMADRIYDLGEARSCFARGLSLQMNGNADVNRLKALLTPYRDEENGGLVRISYSNAQARGDVALSQGWASGWTTACCWPCRTGWAKRR